MLLSDSANYQQVNIRQNVKVSSYQPKEGNISIQLSSSAVVDWSSQWDLEDANPQHKDPQKVSVTYLYLSSFTLIEARADYQ